MGIADSLKSFLKLICGYCGGSDIHFRCESCGKKYCRTCVEFANNAVKKDLESVRTASVLQNQQSVTTFVMKLMGKISSNAKEGYCPMQHYASEPAGTRKTVIEVDRVKSALPAFFEVIRQKYKWARFMRQPVNALFASSSDANGGE